MGTPTLRFLALVGLASLVGCGNASPALAPGGAGDPGDGPAVAATGIAGVWHGAYEDPAGGHAEVELILQDSLRFSQTTQYTAGTNVYLAGTYEVFAELSTIRTKIEDAFPTEFCGTTGCTPIRYPDGESFRFVQPEANTLVLTGSCDLPGCTIRYSRKI
ncbi:MAG: hypothetical protein WD770_06065 [Actinomycetota bacterium]